MVRSKPTVSRLFIGPSESLLLRIVPFDSTVKAELARGGVDPVRFEQEFTEEMLYRFTLRKQEAALDSAGAQVILTVTLRHVQPGVGSTGTFVALNAKTQRQTKVDVMDWNWRRPSKANVSTAHLMRDLSRITAEEILKRIPPARPRPKEPPPPLQLL